MDSTNWFWIPDILSRVRQVCLFIGQFWAIQCFSYLFNESKTAEKIKKISKLRILRQIWFLLVEESAKNSQKANFHLVMQLIFSFKVVAISFLCICRFIKNICYVGVIPQLWLFSFFRHMFIRDKNFIVFNPKILANFNNSSIGRVWLLRGSSP